MHVCALSFNLAYWPAEADFFLPLFFLVLVVNEVAERLAFFGIAVNMVAYLVFEMHQSLPNAATHVTDWIGAAYVLTLFGAFCADAYLGRFRTIIVFSCIYTVVRNQDFPFHLVSTWPVSSVCLSCWNYFLKYFLFRNI
jgi:hypothetical protein